MQSARDLQDHPSPKDEEQSLKDTSFLLGGYSWRQAEFGIWQYQYNPSLHKYEKAPKQNQLAAIGDAASKGRYLLTQRFKSSDYWNMQPLEILRDMLRSGQYNSIGGSPQIAKVYRHMNCDLFGVVWRVQPNSTQEVVTIGGRPLLEWEKGFFPLIDVDDPAQHNQKVVRARYLASEADENSSS